MKMFKLYKLRKSMKFHSNIDRFGYLPNSCEYCGLPTDETHFFHMTTCGRIVNTDDENLGNFVSAGPSPICPDCSKLFPSEFVFQVPEIKIKTT